MATRHKSAMKQLRASKRKHDQRVIKKSELKSCVRKLKESIAAKNTEQVEVNLKETVSKLQKSASRGVIHKNAASRKVSRLMKKVTKSK
jgi:small subunit ribosomal protein S20